MDFNEKEKWLEGWRKKIYEAIDTIDFQDNDELDKVIEAIYKEGANKKQKLGVD